MVESLLPLLIFVGAFAFAFLLEAGVLSAFGVWRLGRAAAWVVPLNIATYLLLYFAVEPLLSALHYPLGNFNGLHLPLPVLAFVWWVSTIFEGALLSLLVRQVPKHRLFTAAAFMNLLSYLFLQGFVLFSH